MRTFFPVFFLIILFACSPQKIDEDKILTVSGEISPEEMGLTLIHEHILVDFIGADSTGYHRWDKDSVVQKVLPFLAEIKARGVKTLVECTPSYLGKDPVLLQKLTEATGIQFITNTGYYGAVEGKYLPSHAYSESAEELSKRWIAEFQNGIEDTGIKPGFIKISVNSGPSLSEMDEKLVRSAAITHKETGLLIVSHTGTWETANAEIQVLKEEKIDLSHFVWVHAQAEKDFQKYIEAKNEGVWISLDGIAWDIPGHLERIAFCKENGLLDHVLLSHDAGWYSPGEVNGGDFKGFTALFDELIPMLKEKGFTQSDLDLLLIENPSKAFSVKLKNR
ncbi:phosphotriesterase family protein [Aquiflexum gelatinilyticum]|uniref:phosphotriesterase family protein n=1 Tax=Aquiflexum gelatinilyticum TaxID=2961943 RepID=UPI00216A2CA1|nr:phosphotriesterase [Aquiflexum gelatinilyticum]MCS4436142.1 phosphotriesterase [Aquiflexum gelatinilyticum]